MAPVLCKLNPAISPIVSFCAYSWACTATDLTYVHVTSYAGQKVRLLFWNACCLHCAKPKSNSFPIVTCHHSPTPEHLNTISSNTKRGQFEHLQHSPSLDPMPLWVIRKVTQEWPKALLARKTVIRKKIRKKEKKKGTGSIKSRKADFRSNDITTYFPCVSSWGISGSSQMKLLSSSHKSYLDCML